MCSLQFLKVHNSRHYNFFYSFGCTTCSTVIALYRPLPVSVPCFLCSPHFCHSPLSPLLYYLLLISLYLSPSPLFSISLCCHALFSPPFSAPSLSLYPLSPVPLPLLSPSLSMLFGLGCLRLTHTEPFRCFMTFCIQYVVSVSQEWAQRHILAVTPLYFCLPF